MSVEGMCLFPISTYRILKRWQSPLWHQHIFTGVLKDTVFIFHLLVPHLLISFLWDPPRMLSNPQSIRDRKWKTRACFPAWKGEGVQGGVLWVRNTSNILCHRSRDTKTASRVLREKLKHDSGGSPSSIYCMISFAFECAHYPWGESLIFMSLSGCHWHNVQMVLRALCLLTYGILQGHAMTPGPSPSPAFVGF